MAVCRSPKPCGGGSSPSARAISRQRRTFGVPLLDITSIRNWSAIVAVKAIRLSGAGAATSAICQFRRPGATEAQPFRKGTLQVQVLRSAPPRPVRSMADRALCMADVGGSIPPPGSTNSALLVHSAGHLFGKEERQDRSLRRAPRPFSLAAQSNGLTHRDPGFESLKGYQLTGCRCADRGADLAHAPAKRAPVRRQEHAPLNSL